MKKSMKKLVLTKETVRRLAGAELNGVAGGYPTWLTNCVTEAYTCYCNSAEVACVNDTSRCVDTDACLWTDVC